jgi:hypothetical protein
MNLDGIYKIFVDSLPFVVAILGALFAARQLLFIKNVKKAGNETIYDILDKKFSAGLIKDQEDIQIIINSISRAEGEVYSVAPMLEDYYTNRLAESSDLDEKEKLARYNLLRGIIKNENEQKPFSGIPDEERRILINMKDALSNKDNQAIEFNIGELNSVLTTRNKIFENMTRLNRWSVPLAVSGVFFTILFGILSFKPNKIDYDKIRTENQTILDEKFEQFINQLNSE